MRIANILCATTLAFALGCGGGSGDCDICIGEEFPHPSGNGTTLKVESCVKSGSSTEDSSHCECKLEDGSTQQAYAHGDENVRMCTG